MKKKLLAIGLITAAILTGCGGKTTNAPSTPAAQNTTASTPATEKFGFSVNGGVIVPGEEFTDKAKLGEPESYFEGDSCYFEGLDKVYYYDGYTVSLYPDKGTDKVLQIEIKGAQYANAKGIKVGSSLDEVKKAYGDGLKAAGNMYKFYVDDKRYEFFFISKDSVMNFGYGIDA